MARLHGAGVRRGAALASAPAPARMSDPSAIHARVAHTEVSDPSKARACVHRCSLTARTGPPSVSRDTRRTARGGKPRAEKDGACPRFRGEPRTCASAGGPTGPLDGGSVAHRGRATPHPSRPADTFQDATHAGGPEPGVRTRPSGGWPVRARQAAPQQPLPLPASRAPVKSLKGRGGEGRAGRSSRRVLPGVGPLLAKGPLRRHTEARKVAVRGAREPGYHMKETRGPVRLRRPAATLVSDGTPVRRHRGGPGPCGL